MLIGAGNEFSNRQIPNSKFLIPQQENSIVIKRLSTWQGFAEAVNFNAPPPPSCSPVPLATFVAGQQVWADAYKPVLYFNKVKVQSPESETRGKTQQLKVFSPRKNGEKTEGAITLG